MRIQVVTLMSSVFLFILLIGCHNSSEKIVLQTRCQIKKIQGKEVYEVKEKALELNPEEVAIIVCDMWNTHNCISAAKRVDELSPFMNHVINDARQKGMFIIHAPSNCMKYYEDSEQRKLAKNAIYYKSPVEFNWNNRNPEHEKALPGKLGTWGCSCDTDAPCFTEPLSPWTKQNDVIEIFPGDAISDSGQEIYNLLEERHIDNVIIMGVHTNICILSRPFGIRQMVYNDKNVMLCRDLTDAFFRNPGYHFQGNRLIIDHIEKYWCPTITSESITGDNPFRFNADNT